MTEDLFAGGEPAKKTRTRKAATGPDPEAVNQPAAEVLPPEGETTELSVEVVAGNPDQAKLILLNAEQFDQFYTRVRDEVSKEVPDVSTPSGRERIRSLAFKVTKTKTAIDKAATGLTEEWRRNTAAVNSSRRVMVDRLQALADETRRPLTEWEEAEDRRKQQCRETIEWLIAAATIKHGETSAEVDARGVEVWNKAIDPEVFQEFEDEAKAAKAATVNALVAGRDRLKQEEADRAELERLRAENEARLAREAEEARQREEREAEERRVKEAEEAAQREREEAEQRQRDEEARVAREREEAAERAREEERKRLEAERDAAVQAEREKAEAAEREAEQARQAERERAEAAEREAQQLRDAEAARVAEQERLAAEERAREANKAHRRQIMSGIKAAILTIEGVTEPQAKALVLALVAGEIPNTRVTF